MVHLSIQVIGSDSNIQVSMVPASIEIQNSGFTVQITVTNTSQHKLKVRLVHLIL